MMKQNKVKSALLDGAFDIIEKDDHLNAWHISLLAAVFIVAIRQKRSMQVKVCRSTLMALSHIKTLPTFHKYFKELQVMGYISYRPSYHPGLRSELDIVKGFCNSDDYC